MVHGVDSSGLFPRFWLVGYPSLVIKFLGSPEFSWSFSLIRLHPQRKSYRTLFISVPLLLIGQHDFSTIIY